MFTRDFQPEAFLRSVFGTEPFLDFCRERAIAFAQIPNGTLRPQDIPRWTAALSQLPRAQQFQVETELAAVNDMAHPDALAQLLAAAGTEIPPDDVPGGAPLALWFRLRHPTLFHEVFLHAEVEDVDAWHNARARPGFPLATWAARRAALLESVRASFAEQEGSGRFGTASVYRLAGAFCFIAHVADRPQLQDGFTEDGRHATHKLRPAVPVVYLYYPEDGTVLLHARLRSRDRRCDLLHRFWRVMFESELDEQCLSHSFRLDLFKRRFEPLADADDMELVRVKTLHLVYPARHGRRQLRLETLASDEPFAIVQLLQEHGGSPVTLELLEVEYAELQIRMRLACGVKNHYVRLWRNRSSLNGSALSERFRECLKRWGIYHAGESAFHSRPA
jgi:hypothetical protein